MYIVFEWVCAICVRVKSEDSESYVLSQQGNYLFVHFFEMLNNNFPKPNNFLEISFDEVSLILAVKHHVRIYI